MKHLTPEQIAEIRSEMVTLTGGVPVRFLVNGCCVSNLETGETSSRGSNVIYHQVYWGFTRETSKKIAGWLGANAVFSE